MSETFSAEQLTQIRAVFREALADAGLRLEDGDHEDEARKDFMFLRTLRRGANGIAAKVGWTLIAAGVGGLVWLVTLGANVWRGTGS